MKSPTTRRAGEAIAPAIKRRRPRLRSLFIGWSVWVFTACLSVTAFAQDSTLKLTDIALTAPAKGTARIVIKTSGSATFNARVTEGGKRILLDLPNSAVAGAPAAIVEGNEVVAGVMAQSFKDPAVTRVLIQLASFAEYSIRNEDGAVVVELAKAEKTQPMGRTKARPEATEQAPVDTGLPSLSDVRYGFAGERDRITIELDKDAKFTETADKNAIRIEIGARLPKSLERTLDVSAFGGAVRSVASFKAKGSDSKVIVEIARDPQAEHMITREGSKLVCVVAKAGLKSTESGKAQDGGAARRTKTVAREADYELPTVETSIGDVSEVEPDQADAVLPGMAGQVQNNPDATRAATGGRRLDLDLKDADIHDVLRLLADVGRVNVITADNVTGSITIRMRNVPWDQALETVLQAKGLGMVRKGNLIRVAPLADLNKERELALARRQSEFQLAPLETRLIPVSYANAQDMTARAGELLSPRGNLSVDNRTNVIIARDVTGNLNQIEELIRALDTQTPQVLIEARIVEASSRFNRELGIQWGGGSLLAQSTGVDTGVAFPNSVGIFGASDDAQSPTDGLRPNVNLVDSPNFAVNLPAATGAGNGGALGFTFGSINNLFNLNVRLSAAETSGMVRIISSPRVLTLDNKEARISQGTLIPFSQVSAQGVQTVFQEAKLQLLVKPHVTADGGVSLAVKINRDEPDFGNRGARGDPTILKRDVTTELLVQDGHTAVIGGIYTRNASRGISQVPVLGDIPILGVLFQRRQTSDQRGELVVFITPRIVNRAESLGR
jgi:type IV pilus assembly protein PilQ